MVQTRLELSKEDELARGTSRSVFVDPRDADRLIKVLHFAGPSNRWLKRRLRAWMPMTQYRFLFREYDTSLTASILAHDRNEPSPVVAQFGLVETSLGLGMVTERIRMPGEPLGRTLRDILLAGTLEEHLPLLNDFVRRTFEWNVRVNDVSPHNIVLGAREGVAQFVMVDGLGDSHVVPLRSLSDRLNRISVEARFKTLARALKANWDPRTRQITFR